MKQQKKQKLSVTLDENEWFYIVMNLRGWDYLRDKIFHLLVSGVHGND